MARKLDEMPLLALQNKKTQRVIVDVDETDWNVGITAKKRSVSLWLSDYLIILVEFVQFYALLLSLSLHWAWPYSWIIGVNGTQPAFLVNVDIWDFLIIQNGAYEAKDAVIATKDVGFNYNSYIAGWMIGVAGACLIGLAVWIVLHYKNSTSVFVQKSILKRVAVVVAQLAFLPYGVAAARLAHCAKRLMIDGETKRVLEVDDNVTCWSGNHVVYLVPAGSIFVLGFIAVSCWMIKQIRSQLFSPLASRHEGYIELKEAEFSGEMDILWAFGNFFLFSSFKRRFVWYRPFIFFIKFIFIMLFASLFLHPTKQIIAMTSVSFCVTLLFLILRPFRLVAFNVLLVLSWFVISCYALLGTLLQLNVENPLLTDKYLKGNLIALSSFAAALFLATFVYLILHHFQVCCSKPLWPSLFQPRSKCLDENTSRYMRAILRGRKLLEVTYHMAPMLTPAHELSRHIQIINAYCREAEQLGDPIHDTLWDLLDELIEAHSNVSPHSIYSASSKKSVHKIAKELNKLMPDFRQRLDQREYDFILMSPLKRRMLLKMYVIGTFVNGRAEKLQLQQQKPKIRAPDVIQTDPKARRASSTTFGGSNIEDEHDRLLAEVEGLIPSESPGLSSMPPSRGETAASNDNDNLLREVEEMLGNVTPDVD